MQQFADGRRLSKDELAQKLTPLAVSGRALDVEKTRDILQFLRGARPSAQIRVVDIKPQKKVKACCTAPSLNPNKTTQKNNASPKRPQFFLPGLLKVALLPGHGCA